jgi:tRNA (guanine-N7-)-methyltransferase
VRRSIRLPFEQLTPYLFDAAGLPHPQRPPSSLAPARRLDWQVIFANDRPVELEVGFGKGLYLVNAARAQPGLNFLGIEIERKYQLFTAARLARMHLSNVRVACADARPLLRDWVASSSLNAVHVYFPDPWWKKRHHKRRVFTGEFASECARVLRPGGVLSVATDVEDYAGLVRQLVTTNTSLRELPPPQLSPAAHDLDYLTNFERKFRKQGKTIWRMRYERPIAAPTVDSAKSDG